MTKTLFAFLLLCGCASAQGPTFSIWHIDGHGHQWQLDQLSAGLPLEPTVRLAGPYESGSANARGLETNAALIGQYSGGPVALRMDNIITDIDRTFPRFALTEDNWTQSHLAIRRLSDGTLDDTPEPSMFAGTEKWSEAGRLWATSVYLRRLQEIIPAPSAVIFRENNEGAISRFTSVYFWQRVFYYRPDGMRRFASLNTPRDQWRDASGAVLGDEWLVDSGDTNEQLYVYRWKTDEELDAWDLRAKAWVGPRRGTKPADNLADWHALRKAQYDALFAAFDANLTPAWRGIRTVGYGADPYHDAGSLQTYMGYYRPASITSPAHAAEIAQRRATWATEGPRSWRELSIWLRASSVFAAQSDGTGDVLDADSHAAFMAHYCWAMQAPGKDVRLVYWQSYLTQPSAVIHAALPEMTVGAAEIAVMTRMQEIHQHPLLRRYWSIGTTSIAPSALNTGTVHRVYATSTELPDSPRKLLAVYTPCTAEQVPEIDVGDYTVPWARWSYYLTEPLEPLPPPVLTLEERVERLEREVFGDDQNH